MHRVILKGIDAAQAIGLKDQLLRDGLIIHEDFEWEYRPTYSDGFSGEERHHARFSFRDPAQATFYQLKWA